MEEIRIGKKKKWKSEGKIEIERPGNKGYKAERL
jgi:hypothetical protein